ncbi:MAG: AbrB family transcriptional regulator [Archaeoglobaceae archaeon]|nr:AbrB family transcriptional regulator [Archaeoglobaceae archaeon]
MSIEIKKLDKHGRISIPKKWREKHGDEVMIIVFDDKLEIFPRKGNIVKFIDTIEVEELEEWEKMKEKLYEVR